MFGERRGVVLNFYVWASREGLPLKDTVCCRRIMNPCACSVAVCRGDVGVSEGHNSFRSVLDDYF